MEGVWFQRVQTALHKLLLLQKNDENIKDALDVIFLLLEDSSAYVLQEEWDAIRSAVLVTLRIVCFTSITKQNFVDYEISFYKIISSVCHRQELMHLQPLLSCLLSRTPTVNSEVDAFSNCIHQFIQLISRINASWEGLGTPDAVPLFGALVYYCAQIAEDTSKNAEARLHCLKTIILLVSDDQKLHLQGCCTVMPGLLARLINIVSSPTEKISILEQSIKLFGDFIIYGFNDQAMTITEFPKSTKLTSRNMNLNRDGEWMELARSKLQSSISLVVSRLCTHRSAEIRESIFICLMKVYEECGDFFGITLDTVVFDTILLMSRDSFERIATSVHEKLGKVKDQSGLRFSKYMHDKMTSLADNLPVTIRRATQTSASFSQLSSLISCLGVDFARLVSSHSLPVVQLLRSFAAVIRVDINRLRVSRNFKEMTVKDIVASLPVQFGVDMNDVITVCSEIALNGKEEAIDLLVSELRASDLSGKIAFSIIILFVIDKLEEKSSYDQDILSLCAEQFLEEVRNIHIPAYRRDDRIGDSSQAPPNETVLAIATICSLTTCSKRLSEGSASLQLLVNGLYMLFQLYSHPSWFVRDAAEASVQELAQNSGKTLSEYILDNSIYLVNRITLASRSYDHYIQAPCVLSALLDVADDCRMFEQVQYITKTMLEALESFNQEWTYGVLRALRSYVKAMNRWYPNLADETTVIQHQEQQLVLDEDNINDPGPVEVERLPPPPTVLSVESILQMTKHLLSSPHVPVKIVVTEILKEGLHFLRNFENILLPILHQNWLTLIQRFSDQELEIWKVSFEVIYEMAMLSNTFVYQRIKTELWPKLAKWLLKESKNRNSFAYSSNFKLLESLLNGLPDVFIKIEISDEDWQNVRPIIENFTKPHVHPHIRSLAANCIQRLSDFVSHKPTTGLLN